MNFELNETEKMLSDTLDRFVLDAPAGDLAQWTHCVDMGLQGASVPEEIGGFGLGLNGGMLVARSLGTMLSPLDWGRDSVLPATLLAQMAPNDAKAADALEAFLQGEIRVAVLQEDSEQCINLPAIPSVGLALILRAAGTELIWLDASEVDGQADTLIDGQKVIRVSVKDMPSQVLPEHIKESLKTSARVMAAADRLGAMEKAFSMTLDYCRTRQQFGRPLSAFQALQHRLVDMSIACDEVQSIVFAAAMAVNAEKSDASRLASAAWERALDLGQKVGEEAIQLHGGIGMTEECDVGHYVKRMMVRRPLL